MKEKTGLFVALLAGMLPTAPARAQGPDPAATTAPQDAPAAAPSEAGMAAEIESLKMRQAEMEKELARLRQAEAGPKEGKAGAEKNAVNDADLAALITEQSEPKLRFYGFLDTGVQKVHALDSSQAGFFPSSAATFVLGRVNLYMDGRPMPDWRALVETRFSLWPHGSEAIDSMGNVSNTSTVLADYTSPSASEQIQWGSILLERAQIEWSPRSWFSLQAGYFLTPWGIWNVDHGTPTLIALMLPGFLSQGNVPVRQQGVMAYGSLHFLPYELGYRAYVSNGRTATQLDFSNDKAFGGRLYLRRPGKVTFALGASGFYGTTQAREKSYSPLTPGQPQASVSITEPWSATEITGGADLSLDWGGLRVRAEGVLRRVSYPDGKHEPIIAMLPLGSPNRTEKFVYGLVAYRFLHYYEPYLYVEYTETGRRTVVFDAVKQWSLGLNLHFNAMAQLKNQFADSYSTNNSGTHHGLFFSSRLVLVF
jgi:hypothetical protein